LSLLKFRNFGLFRGLRRAIFDWLAQNFFSENMDKNKEQFLLSASGDVPDQKWVTTAHPTRDTKIKIIISIQPSPFLITFFKYRMLSIKNHNFNNMCHIRF